MKPVVLRTGRLYVVSMGSNFIINVIDVEAKSSVGLISISKPIPLDWRVPFNKEDERIEKVLEAVEKLQEI